MWQGTITLEPGKRGGRPCVRHKRIAVADVLSWLAAGMSHEEILSDYPELTEADIRACLSYAADRDRSEISALIDPTTASSGSMPRTTVLCSYHRIRILRTWPPITVIRPK